MKTIPLLIITATLSMNAGGDVFKEIIEKKYDSPLERFNLISFSATTKILRFDFKLTGGKSWWSSFNVIEVKKDGTPLYWYDIPQPPSETGIESIRVVELSGKKYLEVIGCTHQGNGTLYLYELRRGVLRLKMSCRVMANLTLPSVRFEPRVAKVTYRDLDGDGDDDVLIDTTCLEGQIIDKSKKKVGQYHREYIFNQSAFSERKEKRIGLEQLMN